MKMSERGRSQLLLLNDPLLDSVHRGKFDPRRLADNLSRDEAEGDSPIISIHWAMGAPVPDELVWTTSGARLILHNRLIEVLRSQGFTGWKTYPLTMHSRPGTVDDNFSGLAYSGRCGYLDLSRCEAVLRKYPAGWHPHLRKIGRADNFYRMAAIFACP
ncbi:MAG: hypothetical protein ACTHLN_15455 [Tepidisphaeraceae bacterium]